MVREVADQQPAYQQLRLVQVGRKELLLALNAEPAIFLAFHLPDQTKILTDFDEFLQRGLTVGLLLLRLGERPE